MQDLINLVKKANSFDGNVNFILNNDNRYLELQSNIIQMSNDINKLKEALN